MHILGKVFCNGITEFISLSFLQENAWFNNSLVKCNSAEIPVWALIYQKEKFLTKKQQGFFKRLLNALKTKNKQKQINQKFLEYKNAVNTKKGNYYSIKSINEAITNLDLDISNLNNQILTKKLQLELTETPNKRKKIKQALRDLSEDLMYFDLLRTDYIKLSALMQSYILRGLAFKEEEIIFFVYEVD